MNISRFICVFTLATLTSACSGSWSTSNVDKASAAADVSSVTTAKSAATVVISEGDLTRPYTALGDISVTVNKTTIFDADPTREMVNDKLKEKAGEMGADAVILVRYGTVGVSFMSWGSLDGKGRAVVYK